MFAFHDHKVPLTLATLPVVGELAECSSHVALAYEADPIVASWGIDGWLLRLLPGDVHFEITTIDPVSGDPLPTKQITVPVAEIPCRWQAPVSTPAFPHLMCQELSLAFRPDGSFEPAKSCATFGN